MKKEIMPKSPEGYQPSREEIKKAEGMMTPEQKEMSEIRDAWQRVRLDINPVHVALERQLEEEFFPSDERDTFDGKKVDVSKIQKLFEGDDNFRQYSTANYKPGEYYFGVIEEGVKRYLLMRAQEKLGFKADLHPEDQEISRDYKTTLDLSFDLFKRHAESMSLPERGSLRDALILAKKAAEAKELDNLSEGDLKQLGYDSKYSSNGDGYAWVGEYQYRFSVNHDPRDTDATPTGKVIKAHHFDQKNRRFEFVNNFDWEAEKDLYYGGVKYRGAPLGELSRLGIYDGGRWSNSDLVPRINRMLEVLDSEDKK